MANKLQITATALAKLQQAETSGNLVQISAFAVTDSSTDDSTTYGNELYKGLISSITKDENNANTVIALAIIPATAKKVGFGRKVFIYDKDNDLIAYGLIPQFELTGATAEAELSLYLSFSNVAAIKLEAPAEAFIDVATFKNHNHNGLYYQKGEVDSFLSKKSDVGHDHDSVYLKKYDYEDNLHGKYKYHIDLRDCQWDTLYPVAWCCSENIGLYRVSIVRRYTTDGSYQVRNGVPADTRLAGLNIELRCAGFDQTGNMQTFDVDYVRQMYRQTAYDLNFSIRASDDVWSPVLSGLYLRGGIQYWIYADKPFQGFYIIKEKTEVSLGGWQEYMKPVPVETLKPIQNK